MRKIMFNDRFLLTKAVIEGDKTQSRSIIYPQPKYSPFGGMVWKGYMSGFLCGDYAIRSNIEKAYQSFARSLKYKKFVYKPGEIVAVANLIVTCMLKKSKTGQNIIIIIYVKMLLNILQKK